MSLLTSTRSSKAIWLQLALTIAVGSFGLAQPPSRPRTLNSGLLKRSPAERLPNSTERSAGGDSRTDMTCVFIRYSCHESREAHRTWRSCFGYSRRASTVEVNLVRPRLNGKLSSR